MTTLCISIDAIVTSTCTFVSTILSLYSAVSHAPQFKAIEAMQISESQLYIQSTNRQQNQTELPNHQQTSGSIGWRTLAQGPINYHLTDEAGGERREVINLASCSSKVWEAILPSHGLMYHDPALWEWPGCCLFQVWTELIQYMTVYLSKTYRPSGVICYS